MKCSMLMVRIAIETYSRSNKCQRAELWKWCASFQIFEPNSHTHSNTPHTSCTHQSIQLSTEYLIVTEEIFHFFIIKTLNSLHLSLSRNSVVFIFERSRKKKKLQTLCPHSSSLFNCIFLMKCLRVKFELTHYRRLGRNRWNSSRILFAWKKCFF